MTEKEIIEAVDKLIKKKKLLTSDDVFFKKENEWIEPPFWNYVEYEQELIEKNHIEKDNSYYWG